MNIDYQKFALKLCFYTMKSIKGSRYTFWLLKYEYDQPVVSENLLNYIRMSAIDGDVQTIELPTVDCRYVSTLVQQSPNYSSAATAAGLQQGRKL